MLINLGSGGWIRTSDLQIMGATISHPELDSKCYFMKLALNNDAAIVQRE